LGEIAAPGIKLDVKTPKNSFPMTVAENYLFIGGGIGITPLIPMIEEAR